MRLSRRSVMNTIPSTPTMTIICSVLNEVYTHDGVATWLASRNMMLNQERPIELCRTPEGRKRVYEVVQRLAAS